VQGYQQKAKIDWLDEALFALPKEIPPTDLKDRILHQVAASEWQAGYPTKRYSLGKLVKLSVLAWLLLCLVLLGGLYIYGWYKGVAPVSFVALRFTSLVNWLAQALAYWRDLSSILFSGWKQAFNELYYRFGLHLATWWRLWKSHMQLIGALVLAGSALALLLTVVLNKLVNRGNGHYA